MKTPTKLASLLFLIIAAINTLVQTGSKSKTSYPHLADTGGFSPSFSQLIFIPLAGFNITFRWAGFRANNQLQRTSLKFDINGYSKPIELVRAISNLKENNSNILLGITFYIWIITNLYVQ